ncbi:MAG: DDE-type integrase/transposase/recombinase, partial [Sphingomonas bacterium]|nr:DDE-type integrase/transposase/recombinase [Sphingomonas bacterium]
AMSEPETENDGQTGPELIASADDLRAIDLRTVLHDLDRADDYAAEQALSKAADAAAGAGNKAAERGYRLLMLLCTLHLRVDDPAETWGPRWQSPEGRSYTGSDFRGEQATVLGGFIDHISHPVLRARVADVVWYNDRSQRGAVSAAISAYCETIARRIDGTFSPRFEDHDDSVLEMVDLFHRALQLHALSRRREPLSQDIRTTFEALYERTGLTSQYVAFEKTAYLGIRYALAEWSRVAPEAEQLAEGRAGGDYPMAVQGIWDLAAKGYASLGDDPAKRRCQVRSVDETLRMREQVGSSSAQAYWTRKAVGELRAAGGFKDRIEVLRTELRNLQDAALDEYGQFSIPLDLSAERKGTIELFEGLTLPDILLQFAIFATRHGKPEAITTDGLHSYRAAMKELGNEEKQDIGRWANNRVENSHLPFRRRERAMLRFRRMKTLQKFASVHANVHNHFNLERHLVDRQTYKKRRSAALAEWRILASQVAALKARAASWRDRFALD